MKINKEKALTVLKVTLSIMACCGCVAMCAVGSSPHTSEIESVKVIEVYQRKEGNWKTMIETSDGFRLGITHSGKFGKPGETIKIKIGRKSGNPVLAY